MRRAILALSAMLLPATLAMAAPPSAASLEQAKRFGALQSIQQISLSPDGNRAAFIGPLGGAQVIFIIDLVAGGTPKPILKSDPKEGRLTDCNWVTDQRLICRYLFVVNQGGQLVGFSRMIAVNADGSKQTRLNTDANARALYTMQYGGDVLDWDLPGKPGEVLMERAVSPEDAIGSVIKREEGGLAVDQVDTLSLRRSRVEQSEKGAVRYISDGHGTVRIMGTMAWDGAGQLRDTVRYLYRKPGSRQWDALSTVKVSLDREIGFEPLAVDRARNVVFGFDDKDGMTALYAISLDGSERRELVLSRPDVDVDELVRIGRNNRVVGASYATQRRTTELFDPELRKLSTALGKALPGQPSVAVVDASVGEAKLLLVAWGDTNPGQFYLYEKATRRLEPILPVRAELQDVPLATMQPVSFAAADGTVIPAYLTLPPGSSGKGLPAIVMPHEGFGSRDEWGFHWLAQFFASRGYAVLQPNFRGSGGYGSAWYQKNGFKSWQVAIGDVNDAGRWLLKEGIAAPGQLGIAGWSYGGYAALQSSVLDPDLFKAIIAVAPVTDLERLRQDSYGFTNYRFVDKFIGSGPHVEQGSPAQNAARIKAPVLMFHGTLDQTIAAGQSRLMETRLRGAGKRVTLVEFPDLGHGLLDAAARTRMLAESDAFLREAFGLAP